MKKEDAVFRKEYEDLVLIHLNRISSSLKRDELSVLDEIALVFNRQYVQGVMLVESFTSQNADIQLITENTSYIDIMNTYPDYFDKMFRENKQDMYHVDTSHALGMDLLASKGTVVFEIYKASCEAITNVAIADTITGMYADLVFKESIDSFKNTDKPVVINSQYFMAPFINAASIGSSLMQYDVFTYNTPKSSMGWVGRVMCHPYDLDVTNMDIYLSDKINAIEKQSLINEFSKMLQNTQPVHITLYNVSAVTTFTYVPEETKEAPLL